MKEVPLTLRDIPLLNVTHHMVVADDTGVSPDIREALKHASKSVAAVMDALSYAAMVGKPVLVLPIGVPEPGKVVGGFPVIESDVVPQGEGWLVCPDGKVIKSR